MPAVSQEELDNLRKKNETLRDQLIDAQSKQAENDAARQREFEALQLQAENARLEGQVAQAKTLAKADTSKAGSANVIDAAKAQLEAANAVKEQGAGAVDINADENRKKKDTGASYATEGGELKVDTGSVPASELPGAVPADVEKNGGNS